MELALLRGPGQWSPDSEARYISGNLQGVVRASARPQRSDSDPTLRPGRPCLTHPVPGFFDRKRLVDVCIVLRTLDQAQVMLVKSPQLILGKIFHTDESIARALQRRHDLVQVQLHRLGVL